MKVSLNLLKFINHHYGSAGDPAPEGVEALVAKIGERLGAVEDVIPFGDKFNDIVIVRVVSCEPHPNADRLRICKVDDGGKTEGIQRDDYGLIQVVCGAPNVRADMFAAWLAPGVTVPGTLSTLDPFVLEARDIRGSISNGMLASIKELGLGDSHAGILELVERRGEQLVPGTDFADHYRLRGDVVIDMENKMFTHRPDGFGWIGIARELEGIQHRPYKSPEWYRMDPEIPMPEAEELKLEVRNELPELVPRFSAIVLRDVHVGKSPMWLQVDLARMGQRSINNIVDYTNFFMMETGQPMHAYDYDKVRALSNVDHAVIGIRHPEKGEKIRLLNGKEIEPRAEAIMITTDKQLIGIGGVMGGADTEVDENTRNIIIESANFDMYSIRRTSMAHGLFTDAVTRFNKGQSPLQTVMALAKIVSEIRQYDGGKVASPLVDVSHVAPDVLERGSMHPPVAATTDFINARLGLTLQAEEMAALLKNVEFDVQVQGDHLTIKAPFWRTDIEIPEDVVEEIGRLYGYDQLPVELPKRSIIPAQRDELLEFKTKLRDVLADAGANEILTYSFVHGDLFEKSGLDKEKAFQLSNAISPDLQYYRMSLMPSLLERVHPNIKAGHNEFALFEIGKAHAKGMVDKDGLPIEFNRISLVFAAEPKTAEKNYDGAPFYQARAYLTHVLQAFGKEDAVELRPLGQADFGDHFLIELITKPFDPNRSAVLVYKDNIVGVIGEYRASVGRALKLPAFTAGFETFHSFLLSEEYRQPAYTPLSRFPRVEQDICLEIPHTVSYEGLYAFVENALLQQMSNHLSHQLRPLDIYQKDSTTKRITFRLDVVSSERTLKAEEVSRLLDYVATEAKNQLNAERI